jgi:hypothetical protein
MGGVGSGIIGGGSSFAVPLQEARRSIIKSVVRVFISFLRLTFTLKDAGRPWAVSLKIEIEKRDRGLSFYIC